MRICAFCAAFVLCALPAFSQRGGAAPPPGRSGPPSPTGPTTGPTPTPNYPNQPNSPNNPFPNPNQQGPYGNTNGPRLQDYFITGRVMLDDGSPPTANIRIERVCNGQAHLQAYTDSKGRFSIQLGTPQADVDTDAADTGMPGPGQRGGGGSFGSGPGMVRGSGMSPFWNCELRAALPGYRSDTVTLSTLQPFETRIGTIVLHRLGGVQASTISVTSALAPKGAQKNYRKALDLIAKQKYDEAEKHLVKATGAYPKYAEAWYALGRVQEHENRLDAAQQSFQSAVAADSHYMSPFNQLAAVAAQQKRWKDAIQYSSRVISANPDAFPSSYWFNALGNYELKNAPAAEKSASELVKIDTAHEFPEAQRMLAALLLNRSDYAGAADHLRSYLALEPHAKNSAQLRQTLAQIERAEGRPATQSQPAAQSKPQASQTAKQ